MPATTADRRRPPHRFSERPAGSRHVALRLREIPARRATSLSMFFHPPLINRRGHNRFMGDLDCDAGHKLGPALPISNAERVARRLADLQPNTCRARAGAAGCRAPVLWVAVLQPKNAGGD